MKHALIITAYKDVDMLNKIIRTTPDDFGIFIHVDRNSSIEGISRKAKVLSLKKVYWGAWEHLSSICDSTTS